MAGITGSSVSSSLILQISADYFPIILVVAFIIFGFISRFIIKRTLFKFKEFSNERLRKSILNYIFIFILLIGVYFSIYYIPQLLPFSSTILVAFQIILTVIAAAITIKFINGFLEIALKRPESGIIVEKEVIPIIKKVVNAFIYAIAFILILKEAGIEISPLVTSLGIAGLVVGLALQDLISNLFGGIAIAMDKSLKLGDYVKIYSDTPVEGYISDITWRTTKILTWDNRLITLPNSKIASGVIENFYQPSKELLVVIPVNISYSNDLGKVEKLTIQTVKKALKEIPGGVKEFEPLVRYFSITPNYVSFNIIFKVKDYNSQFFIKHEVIKRLLKAYKANNVSLLYYPTYPIQQNPKA